MYEEDLLHGLLEADGPDTVRQLVTAFETSNVGATQWLPIGGRLSNRGSIEVSADAGRALIERITNGIDAVLELEHERHERTLDCTSPRDAALAWLGVPSDGLSGMSMAERRRLADLITVTINKGIGKEKRTIDIRE